MPGPVPARSDQRRRRNKPTTPVTAGAARPAPCPEPDQHWHDLARDWFVALGQSGQSDYYQASDWQTARVWTEVLSRQLNAGQRMSAQMVAAWSSANAELLATEGARRRLRLELERLPAARSGPDEVEDELDAHRRRSGKPTGDAARGSA